MIMKHFTLSVSCILTSLYLTFSAPAHAQKPATECPGINLIDQIKKDNPAQYAKLRKLSDELPYGKGTLWKITKEGVKPSWLFGTMHITDPRLLSLKPEVTAALESSDT